MTQGPTPQALFLRKLEKWDGVPRFHYMPYLFRTSPEDNAAEKLKAFMVSAVARALDPGCVVEKSLWLYGGQGLQKSLALRTLVGSDLYTDMPISLEKDSVLAQHSCWVREHGEQFMENPEVKIFVTRSHDTIRVPYSRRPPESQPRSSVIVFTGNHLPPNSLDGSRRVWTVGVNETIDETAIRTYRTRLWAEAVFAHLNGFQFWKV